MANELDKGESLFSRDVYNYVKTKDGKFISMGNLENKFQENMGKIVDDINSSNSQYGTSSNGGSSSKDELKMIYEEEDVKRNSYDYEGIAKVFSEHNRDELWVKFFNTETCVTPVLTLEEAVTFQKNLNKSTSLNSRMKNYKKLECLKQIEKYLFTDLKNIIVIDLNPKIYTNMSQAANDTKDSRENIEKDINIEKSLKDAIPKF